MFLKYVLHLTASERQFLTRIAKGCGGVGERRGTGTGIGWIKRWRRYPL